MEQVDSKRLAIFVLSAGKNPIEDRNRGMLHRSGLKVSEIVVVMGKSEEAVMKKLQRLGLKVVQQRESNWTTSSTLVASEIIVSEELYFVAKNSCPRQISQFHSPNLEYREGNPCIHVSSNHDYFL